MVGADRDEVALLANGFGAAAAGYEEESAVNISAATKMLDIADGTDRA